MSNKTVSEALKFYIDRYLSLNHKRSRHTLSKKTGVSYSTLTRILAGQGETSFEQAVKIMKEVAVLEDLDLFVKRHFPDTYNVLDAFESRTYRSQGLIQAVTQRQSFELLTLASHEVGLSIKLVTERYGSYGLELCKDLTESGVFEYDADHEIYRMDNYPSNNLEVLISTIKSSLDNFYDIAKRTTHYHLTWYTNRVNENAISKIRKILRETDKKILEVMDEPSSAGEISFEYITIGKPTNILPKEMGKE